MFATSGHQLGKLANMSNIVGPGGPVAFWVSQAYAITVFMSPNNRATVALYGPIACRTDYKNCRNPRESSPACSRRRNRPGDWLTWQVALGIVRPLLFTNPGRTA